MIRRRGSFANYFIIILMLSVIIPLCFIINYPIKPNETMIGEKKEYERIISLFDSKPCWMDICPGITTAEEAKQQISTNIDIRIEDIAYWGDDIRGGVKWFFLPEAPSISLGQINWNDSITSEINIQIFTGKEIEYFIDLFEEPEFVLPCKHSQADTPNYWTIGLYYPEKGIRIIVQNQSGTDLFTKEDLVTSVILFIPMDIENIFMQQFESYHNENPLIYIKEWHGYGDLNTY